MAGKPKLSAQDVARVKKSLYYHIDCKYLKGVRISLTEEGQAHQKALSILGLYSTETIATGLKAVDESPFKTVFVIDRATGQPLYALSKNEDYAARAKKKNPKPPSGPAPAPTSDCCMLCKALGGSSCQPLSDGSCICFGGTRQPRDVGLDDSLDELGR